MNKMFGSPSIDFGRSRLRAGDAKLALFAKPQAADTHANGSIAHGKPILSILFILSTFGSARRG